MPTALAAPPVRSVSDPTATRTKLARDLRVARIRAENAAVKVAADLADAKATESEHLAVYEAARSARIEIERHASVSATLHDRARSHLERRLRASAPAEIAATRAWLAEVFDALRGGPTRTPAVAAAAQEKVKAVFAAREELDRLELLALNEDELAAELAAVRERVEQAGEHVEAS